MSDTGSRPMPDGPRERGHRDVRPRRPTIIDVARVAGVSKSTVSAVLRGTPGTSLQAIERVGRAIVELDYQPNNVARQLVGAKSKLLGVVVGDLSNQFFAQMAVHVERSATHAGYSTIFCNTLGDPDRELGAVARLLQQQVAGILFLSMEASTDLLRDAVGGRVPVVFATCRADWADSVCIDDRQAAYLATRHLLELGHRRIAFVSSKSMESVAHAERLDGYRAALRAGGLSDGPKMTWTPGDSTIEVDGVRRDLKTVLADRPTFSGIFAVHDFIGVALLDSASALGFATPEDFAITSIDNISSTGLHSVSLTTVAQPFTAAAEESLSLLIRRINEELTGPPTLVTLPVALVARRSTTGRHSTQNPHSDTDALASVVVSS
jgi:DNA-binding LacI/PurR family transcriptional regulator